MQNKIVKGLGYLIIGGLLIAVLRQFGWDPFAAGAWVLSEVWAVLNHVADLFQSNETFQEVTREPKN